MDNQKNQTEKLNPKVDINADVVNQYTGDKWYYSDIVKDHFFNPRNLMLDDPDESQYDAVGMVGSPACLAGDTLIAIADRRKFVSIKDLVLYEQNNVPVFCHDGENILIRNACNIKKTRKNARIIKIVLDDNSNILATPDHLFMMRDHNYREAAVLQSGDSLMPFFSLISYLNYSREQDLLPTYNHKVQSIDFYGCADVYDMSVEDVHNFAVITRIYGNSISGVFVHNCGDMMKMWLKIDPALEKITEMKWRTFGCGSAIAATSMFSVMVTENGGMPVIEALKIKPQHIMDRLGGLPNRKIHCSVLADKAFRKAINEYFRRTAQYDRIIIEGARVIDHKLNITDKDIEEAVLEGAMDIEGVQRKLKVGVGSPEIMTEVEQLIRFYKEKYYG